MPANPEPQPSRAERRAKKSGKAVPDRNPKRGQSTMADRGAPATQGKRYAFRRS
jgi:hypothetical protein